MDDLYTYFLIGLVITMVFRKWYFNEPMDLLYWYLTPLFWPLFLLVVIAYWTINNAGDSKL